MNLIGSNAHLPKALRSFLRFDFRRLAAAAAIGAVISLPLFLVLLTRFGGAVAFATYIVVVAGIAIPLALLFMFELFNRKLDGRLEGLAGHYWALTPLLDDGPGLVPPLGGVALSPRTAHALLEEMIRLQPRNIVEFGPGASTILMAHARRLIQGDMTIYGVEHDEGYASRLDWYLEQLDLLHDCHVVRAPLEDQVFDTWTGPWYASDRLDGLPETIDLLLVDGPPNPKGTRARYPALPVVWSRVRAGGVIIVDDTDRRDEREVVRRWLKEFQPGLHLRRDGGRFVVLEVVDSREQ